MEFRLNTITSKLPIVESRRIYLTEVVDDDSGYNDDLGLATIIAVLMTRNIQRCRLWSTLDLVILLKWAIFD